MPRAIFSRTSSGDLKFRIYDIPAPALSMYRALRQGAGVSRNDANLILLGVVLSVGLTEGEA